MKKLILLLSLFPGIAYAQFTAPQGGTGLASYASGDLIVSTAVNPIRLSRLTVGANGTCLMVVANLPAWGTCGGGGSGGGTWATTTSTVAGQLINYPLNSTDIVCIGGTATTTCKYWFDPNALVAYLAPNVGIGTTSPWATLSVNPIAGAALNQFVVGSSTATAFLIDNSGRATFGSSNGFGDTLSIQGRLGLLQGQGLFFRDSSNLDMADIIGTSVDANNGYLPFRTRGAGVVTERIRIDQNGLVGIGTSSPKTLLSIASAASNAVVSIDKPSSSQIAAVKFTTAGVSKFAITNSAALDGTLLIASDEFGNSPKVAVMPTGNVGIGTTTPCSSICRLGVVAGVSGALYPVNGVGMLEYSGNTVFSLAVPDASSAGYNFPNSTDPFYSGIFKSGTLLSLRENSVDILTATANLSVGIGTSSPGTDTYNSKLNVVGKGITTQNTTNSAFGDVNIINDLGAGINEYALGSTFGGTTFGGVTGNNQSVYECNSSTSSCYIGTNGSSIPLILAVGRAMVATVINGRFGIGTTSPGTNLGVAGTGLFGDYLTASLFNATSTASSTFAGGIDAARVCLKGTTTCLGGSSGSGTVATGVATQLAFYNTTGTTVTGSSSDSLTIGRYIATSTIASQFQSASTTALTSTGAAYFGTLGTSNVGINNIAPVSKLDITSSAGIMGLRVRDVLNNSVLETEANNNVGMGTSSANWSLEVASSTPFIDIMDNDAASGSKHLLIGNQNGTLIAATSSDLLNSTSTAVTFAVTAGGHLYSSTTAPTISSGVIDGTDWKGRVTGASSPLVITFATAYIRIPPCFVFFETGSVINAYTVVPTATNLTITQTGLGTIDYDCGGHQ